MATGPDTRNKKGVRIAQRQEDLREYLSEQLSLRHVIESIKIIDETAVQMEAQELQGKKIALEAKLKLLNKYLPDLKSIEMSGDLEHKGGLTITWQK